MQLTPAMAIQAILRGYSRYISPLLPAHCRFHPSCSHYADEAIAKHGLRCGAYLTIRRVLKCHPWHPGGIDPVPECRTSPSSSGRT